MYMTTGFLFLFCWAGGGAGRGGGLLFIVFTDSILSAYPFKFSSFFQLYYVLSVLI